MDTAFKNNQNIITNNIKKDRRNIKDFIMKKIMTNYVLYLMLLPTLVYIVIFQYIPIYGIQLAFKDFIAKDGIMGSPWVGFQNFERFFNSPYFLNILSNTLGISIYSLLVNTPIPIILALMLHNSSSNLIKKVVQNATYIPHFISIVVMVGMIILFLSPRSGIVNIILMQFGKSPVNFMAEASLFKSLYVWTGVWQNTGWASIIYLAALAGVSQESHEAAIVDGATKLKRIWHIDIPALMPTIIILFIMNMGSIMSVGFEKAFLMQNPLNLSSSEIISTYNYKIGIINGDYGYGATVGLFNSTINFVLLVIVNRVAKKLSGNSLW